MSEVEVRALSKKLDRVLYILENDDSTNEKGLVATVADNEDMLRGFIAQYKIDKAIEARDKKWYATIFGIAGGILATIGKFVIGLMFK